MRLSEIALAGVASFVTSQKREGFKGWTIKGQLSVLSAVFKYAERHVGLAGRRPLTLLARQEKPDTEDERPKRVLTSDELHRLLANAGEPYRTIFELVVEGSMQQISTDGRLFAAQWTAEHPAKLPISTMRTRSGTVAAARAITSSSGRAIQPGTVSSIQGCAVALRPTGG